MAHLLLASWVVNLRANQLDSLHDDLKALVRRCFFKGLQFTTAKREAVAAVQASQLDGSRLPQQLSFAAGLQLGLCSRKPKMRGQSGPQKKILVRVVAWQPPVSI